MQNPSAELTSKCKQLFERLHSIDSEQVRLCMELLGKDPKKTQLRAFAHKNHPNKAQVGPRKGQLNLKNLRPPEKWQQEGRGLYFVVNEGGDKAAEITSCVACFFELDGLTKEQQESRISKFPELKDLIGLTVATREGDDGSLHSYFLLEEPVTDVWHWRLLQWRLIQLFKSDEKVEDPSRVMRLPGAWYVLGDGNFHSRSHIVKTPSTGKRLSFEALEKAIAEAEHVRGLSALDAIPEARWRDQPVQEMMSRLFPEETAKRQQHTTNHRETVQNFERGQYPEHTFEEIRAALSMMPPRRAGLQTYKEDRLVMCGLAAAIEEIGLEVGHVFALLDEFGWEGWDAENVLDTSTVRSEGYFWNHAKKCGHDSSKWRKERKKQQEAEEFQEFRTGLRELFEADLGGSDLTFELMELGKKSQSAISLCTEGL